jgi:4-hydroxy-4-methyl-2-oxoglutarate aldolase
MDDSEILRQLAALSTSAIADAIGGTAVPSPGLFRISGSGTVAGRVVTAECADGSLLAVFAALDQAKPGDVLCMTAPGSSAYLGDLLASDIANRGLTGAVVDGLVRDKDTVAGMSLSVFARGVTPFARRGSAPGRAMVPVEIGGVTVHPGDWIVADGDGVVFIKAQNVIAALEQAKENAEREERIMARIKAGASVMAAVQQELDH